MHAIQVLLLGVPAVPGCVQKCVAITSTDTQPLSQGHLYLDHKHRYTATITRTFVSGGAVPGCVQKCVAITSTDTQPLSQGHLYLDHKHRYTATITRTFVSGCSTENSAEMGISLKGRCVCHDDGTTALQVMLCSFEDTQLR